MHVARIRSGYTDKEGQRREYESRYLRRTYRDDGKVRHETLANLSGLPEQTVDSIEAALKGTALVPAARAVTILRSLPHGHVAAVHAMAVKLGLPALLGPACPERDLALALIISRVVAPASKLSTLTWWADTTLGADLGAAAASAGRIYAAMDWLEHRQDAIEAKLARRHLAPAANPARMALFDLSSRGWRDGTARWPPAGTPGTARKGNCRSSTGCSPTRRPPGRGPGVPRQHRRPRRVHRDRHGGAGQVRAGQDGHGRGPRHDHQRPDPGHEPAGDGTARPDPYEWITALRAPAIRKLMADDGPLQLSPVRSAGPRRDHLRRLPRRAADRLPQPGPGRRPGPHPRGTPGRHREAARPGHRPGPGRPPARRRRDRGRGRQGDHQVQDRQALRRHHHRSPAWPSTAGRTRSTPKPSSTGSTCCAPPSPPRELDAAAVVTAYKNLKYVERDFRHIKSDDLDLRPVFHRLEERVKAHVLICMLACYLTWHLRRAWAPLTFTDQDPPAQDNPVTPARRSARRPGQGLRPARPGRAALPQLPRPARAPGHLDPQPGPVRRHPRHRAGAGRAHQRPAGSLRPHRRPDPAHLEVARTPTPPKP